MIDCGDAHRFTFCKFTINEIKCRHTRIYRTQICNEKSGSLKIYTTLTDDTKSEIRIHIYIAPTYNIEYGYTYICKLQIVDVEGGDTDFIIANL